MESLPKEENNEVRKHIIRTTIKNENLLARKMELDKIKKKAPKKLNNSLKHRLERGLKVNGVLASKIQQSIDKARYVQGARKAGWDQINKTIVVENALVEKTAEPVVDAEKQAEDDYVKEFYGEAAAKPAGKANPFALLPEEDN